MDRPARRDHGLAVGDQQVPGLVGFAEQVDDPLGLGEAEVQVALGPAVVRVGGHGVPGAAGVQRGHAEDDLAAAYAVRVDVLVDRTAVRGLLVAELEAVALTGIHLRGGEVGVCRCREDVVRRVRSVEDHLTDAAADVQAGSGGQLVLGAVGSDRAGATDVDDAGFAAFEEVFAAQLGPRAERQRAACGAGAGEDDPVVVGEHRGDRVRREEVVDQVVRAQRGGVEAGHLSGVGGMSDLEGAAARSRNKVLFHRTSCQSGLGWNWRRTCSGFRVLTLSSG